MDYRHTEDFSRSMEAAALRSRYLRSQAPAEFWGAVARWLGAPARRAWQRLAARFHRDPIFPEA
jgi:hypothetical protein